MQQRCLQGPEERLVECGRPIAMTNMLCSKVRRCFDRVVFGLGGLIHSGYFFAAKYRRASSSSNEIITGLRQEKVYMY